MLWPRHPQGRGALPYLPYLPYLIELAWRPGRDPGLAQVPGAHGQACVARALTVWIRAIWEWLFHGHVAIIGAMRPVPVEEFRGTERFSIVRRLGAGGMGVVYEAYDRERQVRVALKTLLRFDATALYQFKREFRALTELVHENVVSLHELISDRGQWFFTMELIDDGVDLIAYVAEHVGVPQPATTSEAVMGASAGEPLSRSLSSPASAVSSFGDALATMPDAEWLALAEPQHGEVGDALATMPGMEQPATEPTTRPTQPTLPLAVRPAAPGRSAASSPDAATRDYARLRAIFAQLAQGVQALHGAGKLHRDLKPTNVLVRQQSGRVMLLDFGLVAELAPVDPAPVASAGSDADTGGWGSPGREVQTSQGQVAGTIAYMAPEQAAGAPLSQASDWYAVGVMLYQALTGRLPIMGPPMMMLYQKQVLDPPRPSTLEPAVPADLDELCMALLAREPAARPTGAEVLARLTGRQTRRQTGRQTGRQRADSTSGPVEPSDALPAFQPFLGREAQLQALRLAFDDVLCGHTVVYRVHGPSGAGKSTLLQHFLDDSVRTRGAVVLTGRCYEQESVPYKAVDSLIDALTRYLLGCSADERHTLLPSMAALGALSRLFPVLRRIPDVDAAAENLADTSDLRGLRQQAFVALRQLLQRLSGERPLVLYIDDLQWGDVDSAELLAELLAQQGQDAPPRLLLLVAYRSEYADSSPCLRSLAASGLARDPALHRGELAVHPLTAEDTRELARILLRAHGIGGEDDGTNEGAMLAREQLAAAIAAEARGSALYVHELVRHLASGHDLAEVAGSELDSVLWQRVAGLPAEARRLVEVVAVAGQPLKLRHAEEAAELGSLRHVAQRLLRALRSEHLVRTSGPGLDDVIECFHDRVRESVIAHLAAETLHGHHLGLARTLERAGDADPETLAAHYLGAGVVARASHYYEQAADKALQALAFDRAEAFYKLAQELASDQPQDQPQQSDGNEARVRLCEKLIHFYTDVARFDDAYAAARQGLALLGVKLPATFVPPLFVADLAKATLRLRGRAIEALVDLPTMRDGRLEAAVRLMSAVAKAAYQIRPELCVAVATKIVNLCLKHGNTRDCAIGYMVFGAIFQGGVLGRHRMGHEFGRLALALVERHGNAKQRAEVHFVVGYFGTSWLRPAAEAEELWRVAYRSGLDTGDLFHTGCAACSLVLSQYLRGVPLDQVWATSEQVLGPLERAGLRVPMGAITAVRQAIRNLRGLTESPTSLGDRDFDETAFAAALPDWGIRHFEHFYFLCKLQALYLWGAWDEALALAERAACYRKESRGMLHGAEHGFLVALVLAAAQQNAPRRSQLRQLAGEHDTLARLAAQCPANFSAKERVVAAELARCRGRASEALQRYIEALRSAADHGQLHIQALAHARVAALFAATGKVAAAQDQREQAAACYRRWGADAYAARLIVAEPATRTG